MNAVPICTPSAPSARAAAIPAPVHDPAGRDNGCPCLQPYSRDAGLASSSPRRSSGAWSGVEHPAVPAGLVPLGHDRVDPGGTDDSSPLAKARGGSEKNAPGIPECRNYLESFEGRPKWKLTTGGFSGQEHGLRRIIDHEAGVDLPQGGRWRCAVPGRTTRKGARGRKVLPTSLASTCPGGLPWQERGKNTFTLNGSVGLGLRTARDRSVRAVPGRPRPDPDGAEPAGVRHGGRHLGGVDTPAIGAWISG